MKQSGRILLCFVLFAVIPWTVNAQGPRTDLHKRVGIVFSETSANNFYSKENYSQLFMAVQHQAMQAGVPFTILTEQDLTDLSKLVNLDALLFPSAPNVTASALSSIEANLLTLVNSYGIGIITSGDFLVDNIPPQSDLYSRMKNILGVTYRQTVNGTTNDSLVASHIQHPVLSGYAPGEEIIKYPNLDFNVYRPTEGTSAAVLASYSVNGVNYDAVVATIKGNGARNVHFSHLRLLGDTNLGQAAIRWAVYGGSIPVGLKLSRKESLFMARNDMDQTVDGPESIPTVTQPLANLVSQWKEQYNFVGSFYINIGTPVTGPLTDWLFSEPVYRQFLDLGNEIGSHSYSHPDNTNILNDAQLAFEFGQSRTDIQSNLQISAAGAAVPGNPETIATSQKILQYYDYISGGYSGAAAGYYPGAFIGAGSTGAFGYLTPSAWQSSKSYFAPSMVFDFTLVEFGIPVNGIVTRLSPAQADGYWANEFQGLIKHAAQPIIVWPWHDYAATSEASPGRVYFLPPGPASLHENVIKRAYEAGAEFVTLSEGHNRITDFINSGLIVEDGEGALTVRVDGTNNGKFSIAVGGSETITKVNNWYAYSGNRVFLPKSGGVYQITLGTQPEPNTRISDLPMRAELENVSGDGHGLQFSFRGEGSVKVLLNSSESDDVIAAGADSSSIINSGPGQSKSLEMIYSSSGLHSGNVTILRCGDGQPRNIPNPQLNEACDDANAISADGCSASCQIETGYICAGWPSLCYTVCGDGIAAGNESCDDANLNSGDGCSPDCRAEPGFVCEGSPSKCAPVCGDGAVAGAEQCDDGNRGAGDGCSSNCGIEPGYTCAGNPSICSPPDMCPSDPGKSNPGVCGCGAPDTDLNKNGIMDCLATLDIKTDVRRLKALVAGLKILPAGSSKTKISAMADRRKNISSVFRGLRSEYGAYRLKVKPLNKAEIRSLFGSLNKQITALTRTSRNFPGNKKTVSATLTRIERLLRRL